MINRHKFEDLKISSNLPATQVEFEFYGVYQNLLFQWEAKLITLEHYFGQWIENNNELESNIILQEFFNISGVTNNRSQIEIVLDIPIIKKPDILKAVIMVRNYKNLARGKHIFGKKRKFKIE